MARFYGNVGFVHTAETKLGVYENQETVKQYTGDVLSDRRRWEQTSDTRNSNLTIDNRISIVSDSYALENFSYIRFVEWMGVKWSVTNLEIQLPRLILTIGEVYNGEES